MNISRIFRRLTLVVAVCLTPFALLAQTQQELEASRAQVALLKKASFRDLRDLHAVDLQSNHPSRTRVSLYLGVPVANFKLQQISVSFDGRVATTRKYSQREIRALDGGHLHRLARVNLAPGSHSALLTYTGALPRPFLDDKIITGEIPVEFEKIAGEVTRLIVPVVPDVFGIELLVNPDTWAQKQLENDPRLGMARFLRATGKRYQALISLLEMAGPSNSNQVLPLAYDIELAHSYVDYGMREEADQAMRTAFDTGVALSVLADVWLRIAELDYQRGDPSRAYELLQYVKGHLTPELFVRWQDTLSRLYMAEGQYEQAREVLEMGDNATEVLTDVDLPANQTVVMRFNYAVALLKTGETARGRTLLERIGRVTAFEEDQRALRDKANLLLGYNFLSDEQGATGKHILERIRLDGPYSNEALLSLGWAELAPEGTRQPRALVGDEPEVGEYGSRNPEAGRIIKKNQSVRLRDDPYSRIQLGPFRMANMADSKRVARTRSLVAWTEVAKNSPQDPAVQEALIAIPYAMSALGQPSRAFDQYLKAIELLELSRAELTRYANAETIDLTAISNGDLSGLPDTPWMLQFLAENKFNEHFQNYKTLLRIYSDLRRLATYGNQGLSLHLSKNADRKDTAQAKRLTKLREALLASAQKQARLSQQAIATEIKKQQARLDKYLIAARLGVARFEEQKLKDERSPKPEPDKKESGFSLWPF